MLPNSRVYSALAATAEVKELEINSLQLKLQGNNKSISGFWCMPRGKNFLSFLSSPNRDSEE